uniref:Uncharacterized protein n=1 Tax=Octopus bimaculoides TaxID=37653 RepID=A0A0L8HHY5_OCTBM
MNHSREYTHAHTQTHTHTHTHIHCYGLDVFGHLPYFLFYQVLFFFWHLILLFCLYQTAGHDSTVASTSNCIFFNQSHIYNSFVVFELFHNCLHTAEPKFSF